MPSAPGARIRDLSAALDEECRRRGHPLRPGAAEELLTSRIAAVSTQLGISETSALKMYVPDDWPTMMADSLAETMAQTQANHQGPPLTIPAVVAAQLVSALGVAAKYAAINAEFAHPDECATVVDHAGDALTVLGAALRQSIGTKSHEDGVPVAHVDRKEMIFARDALHVFFARLSDGSWRDCWCGIEDFDHIDLDMLAGQVGTDLRLVELVLEKS